MHHCMERNASHELERMIVRFSKLKLKLLEKVISTFVYMEHKHLLAATSEHRLNRAPQRT